MFKINCYTLNFKAKNLSNIVKNKNSKNFLPKAAIAVLLPLSVIQATNCCDPRINDKTTKDGYTVEYFDVKKKTKDAIDQTLIDFEEAVSNTDFMKGLKIDVANRSEDLNDIDAYRRFIKNEVKNSNIHGASYFSDNSIPKRVYIQEAGHNDEKLANLFKKGSYSANDEISFTLMHELGHQFDKFYGHDANAPFAIKRDEMLSKNAQIDSSLVYECPKAIEDQMIELDYRDNSGLSDKQEFKKAFLKDLQKIADIKKTGNGKLADNIDYFIRSINFKKEIDSNVVDYLDGARAEVYANLFSYAVGENDGDKNIFTQNFENSFNVVKDDVINYLNFK